MVNAAAYGNEGTAMMPFTTQHTAEEIAAVIDYIRDTFMGADINPSSVPTTIQRGHTDHDGPLLAARTPADPHAAHGHGATEGDMTAPYPDSLVGDASKGKVFFEDNCAECHGMKGAGDGSRAYFINPKPRDLTSPKARVELNRPHLFSAVSMGVKGREMAAWSKVIGDQQIADVAEYVFTAFIQPEPIITPDKDGVDQTHKTQMHDHSDGAHDHEADGVASKKN
jgi:mono/diheme cytochrome c family protein